MSTPILALTPDTVKEEAVDKIKSVELSRHLEKTSFKSLNLPTNLAAQAFLIAHLPPQLLQTGVIWFVASHRDLDEAQTLLKFWFKSINNIAAPEPELFIFPQSFITWLSKNSQSLPNVLLVAIEHLPLALPSPILIKEHTIKLQIGDKIKPLIILTKLESAGYEPGPLPDSSGWWQKIGGTITIATDNGNWRLTWNNDILEKIEDISLDSGLIKKSLLNITILPKSFSPDPANTLLNHITNQLLIGAPADFAPKYENRIAINPIASQNLFNSVPLFATQWSELTKWLLEKKQAEEIVYILTKSPYKILDILSKANLTADIIEVTDQVAAVMAGFVDKKSGVNYLTDRELYGAVRSTKRRSLASYEKLKTGDYLVHIDHGIGRFGGLTQKEQAGVIHEYFLIHYAEDDKLFVPIEHTDRLSRYLGSPHPQLERLSSAHWYQIQKKIKIETAALAGELLSLYAKRHISQTKPWQIYPEEDLLAASFPYPLTSDQLKTWSELSADLSGRQPMDRLICGDVGFGKTELAIRTSARAALNGYQTAVLAPTTILAQQHFDTFSKRLSPYAIKIGLVSRAQSTGQIRQTLKDLANNQIDIIIGTHRLLGNDVKFHNLGLLIIDEEQRFGVKQKEKLRSIKPSIHVLALSATPIPRTLNLAVSSLRDLSIILSPPSGRQSVNMIFTERADAIIKQAIQTELQRQGQLYYLVQYVKDLPAAELRLKTIYPKLKIGVIHGRKLPREVAHTMHLFDAGQLDLLLATSIIENGLDLPNVNTLIVENAQNFGLADLYQLKGRVGRGSAQAYAYFLTANKKSVTADKRLEALAQTENLGGGLSLALKDLELRGAGAILGREQHGQVVAVGLHLYGQMLADAIEEQRTGQTVPLIPEVRLNLPLEGRISSKLIAQEEHRIHLYQRLASIREPNELFATAQELIGRPFTDSEPDKLFINLLTLLEIKLLAEKARLHEINCHQQNYAGKFSLRFLEAPPTQALARLINFDDDWHKVESTWQAEYTLASGAWIPWLKASLKLLQN